MYFYNKQNKILHIIRWKDCMWQIWSEVFFSFKFKTHTDKIIFHVHRKWTFVLSSLFFLNFLKNFPYRLELALIFFFSVACSRVSRISPTFEKPVFVGGSVSFFYFVNGFLFYPQRSYVVHWQLYLSKSRTVLSRYIYR